MPWGPLPSRAPEVSLVVWLGIGQPALEAKFPILPLWKFLFWRRGLKQVWLSNHFWCLCESILRFFSKLCLQRLGHFCNSRGACTRTVEASSCAKEASSMASTQMPLSGAPLPCQAARKCVGHPFCSGIKSLLQNSFTCYVSANAGNDCWSHAYANGHREKTNTFANLSHTPANPTFIFRGVASIHFCAVETHSNSMQTATVWAIRETAKGIYARPCWEISIKFRQEIAEFHCLPRLLDLPLQRCRVGYWLPWTSWSQLFSRNFRETFAKKPLHINQQIHTLNRG